MANQRDMEANPEKIKALVEMMLVQKSKRGRKPCRRIVVLRHLVLKAADKCLTFFKILNGGKSLSGEKRMTWPCKS